MKPIPNVRRYLDVSTAHVTPGDMKLLNERNPIIICYPYAYGAWVHVYDVDIEQDLKDSGHSPAVWQLLQLARQHDCDWIKLDADADHVDGLPNYEW
jgi:hypothetical protein